MFVPKVVTAAQCRAGRALVGWTQTDLAQRARVARKTVADYEIGLRRPHRRTLLDITVALQEAGVILVNGGVGLMETSQTAQRMTGAAPRVSREPRQRDEAVRNNAQRTKSQIVFLALHAERLRELAGRQQTAVSPDLLSLADQIEGRIANLLATVPPTPAPTAQLQASA